MTETLAYGYSFESTQRELSNEYPTNKTGLRSLRHCALDESRLSIGRVKFQVPVIVCMLSDIIVKA